MSSAKPAPGQASSSEQQLQEALKRLEQAIVEAQRNIDRAIEELRRSARLLEQLARGQQAAGGTPKR